MMSWRLRAFVRLAAALVLVVTVVLLILLPAHDHDWMQQMDSSIGPGDIEDSSRNTPVTAALIAVAGASAAVLIGWTARNRYGRGLAVFAALFVATMWWIKFG